MSLDLLPALRDAVMQIAEVVDNITQWGGEPAIFTRRPVPSDATYPLVLISGPISIVDQDGLNSDRPVAIYDVLTYGQRGKPGSVEDQVRVVERMGFEIRDHFHRNKFSVQPDGFYVIDVQARGPMIAPTDDEQTVGRVVTLTIRLRRE